MAYSKENASILETDDQLIGSLGVGLLFILATAGMLGFVSQNTTLFSSSGTSEFIIQFFLAFGFLFILAIAANYKGLDIVQDHTYGIIKWCYIISISIFLGFLALFGLAFLAAGSAFGIIFVGLAALIGFFIRSRWSWIDERIRRAAEWIKISATIVLNEPGMILLSFIQSIIIGITAVVEFITIFAWVSYAEQQALSDDATSIILYLIVFLYLWLSLSVIYYFDGANTFISYARIHGKDPKVGQGINVATKRFFSLVGYALISAIIFMITRALYLTSREMRADSKNVGQAIFATLVGFLGAIVEFLYYFISFFTLPSIIIRQNSTLDGMRESKNLFSKTFWDMIISDMGYSYGAIIMYVVTGFFLSIGGFIYGYFIGYVYFETGQLGFGIIMAIVALIFGLFISKFFLKPLYTALVTTIYVYATEGPEALEIVPTELKSYLDTKANSPNIQRTSSSIRR